MSLLAKSLVNIPIQTYESILYCIKVSLGAQYLVNISIQTSRSIILLSLSRISRIIRIPKVAG